MSSDTVPRVAPSPRLRVTQSLSLPHLEALPHTLLVTILARVTKESSYQVNHVESGRLLVEQARWCNSFASKARGFTFRRGLKPGEGLVLVEAADSRVNSGITMLFCFIDLGVVWVNSDGEVVDKVIAKPWRPSYLPQSPARYAIEADPNMIDHVQVGDHLEFVDLATVNEADRGTTKA